MQKQIKDFVKFLANIQTPDSRSINIYQGDSYEAKLCRKNLLTYLLKMNELQPDTIIIGEAPTIHGCARTGIPFSDEYALATESFFENHEFHNMGLDHERTAAVIWNVLSKKNTLPLLWNIYPFLPLNTNKKNNRMPVASEIELGRDIFMEILFIFRLKNFYAIGRKAYDALKEVIPDIKYIRHPSHGGIDECTKALNDMLE